MQDLTVTLLLHGALFLGYASHLLAYILLRKKARKTTPNRPILHLRWWKKGVTCLCAALHAGVIGWLIGIAHLFARLTNSMKTTCASHMSPEECSLAALDWHTYSSMLSECGFLAAIIIVVVTLAESKRIYSQPECFYPLALLAWSHGLLVTSWSLCTPLKHSLRVFSHVGKDSWIAASLTCAVIAVLAYIIGISLWAIAVMRMVFAWQRNDMGRSSGVERRVDRSRDIALQDMHA